MSLVLTGRVSRTIERPVTPVSSAPFTEVTYVIEDWGQTLYVTRAKNFDGTVVEGDQVTLAVSVRAYVTKDGKAGYSLTAHRVVTPEAQAAPADGKRAAVAV